MNKNYLSEIYKVEAEKYSKTRDIHWRVNISIWTVLIVAIYVKFQNGFDLTTLSHWLRFLIYSFYLIVHAIFIFKMHGSLNRSLARMHDMATYLIEDKNDETIKWMDIGKKAPKPNYYWEFLQLSISLFLIGIFHFMK